MSVCFHGSQVFHWCIITISPVHSWRTFKLLPVFHYYEEWTSLSINICPWLCVIKIAGGEIGGSNLWSYQIVLRTKHNNVHSLGGVWVMYESIFSSLSLTCIVLSEFFVLANLFSLHLKQNCQQKNVYFSII